MSFPFLHFFFFSFLALLILPENPYLSGVIFLLTEEPPSTSTSSLYLRSTGGKSFRFGKSEKVFYLSSFEKSFFFFFWLYISRMKDFFFFFQWVKDIARFSFSVASFLMNYLLTFLVVSRIVYAFYK